jgi:hypothetical protein
MCKEKPLEFGAFTRILNPLACARFNARRLDQALHIAWVLWQRSVVVGLFLFILPPTGQLPYRWQAAVVFALLVAWCYSPRDFCSPHCPNGNTGSHSDPLAILKLHADNGPLDRLAC